MKKVVFGTTNNRKLEDLQNIVKKYNLDMEVLSLSDIGWDLGEIEENGETIEENSLIKAKAIYSFCAKHNIDCSIMTDDAGLFVEALNGKPGVYTARFADDELAVDSSLPKHQCLYKLLRLLNGEQNRKAEYRCAVTLMDSNGKYKQIVESSKGFIDTKINEPIKKPYFYSLFVDAETKKPFNTLTSEELANTYRYKALTKAFLSTVNTQSRNK